MLFTPAFTQNNLVPRGLENPRAIIVIITRLPDPRVSGQKTKFKSPNRDSTGVTKIDSDLKPPILFPQTVGPAVISGFCDAS